MNVLIRKVFVFFFVFALAIASLNFYLTWKLDKNKYYALPKKKTILVLGNSQPEHAVNDSMITKLSNLAQSGEAYFYTYIKLKRVLKANPQIRTVFLGISNNSIEKRMDEWIWDENYMAYRYPKYAPVMTLDELSYLAAKNPECFVESQIKTIKNNFSNINQLDTKHTFITVSKWGGYKYQVRDSMDSLLAKKTGSQPGYDLDTEMNGDNIDHARDIVDYCKKKGVRIILVRFPVHRNYASLANEPQFIKTLQTRFKDVSFIDFKNYPLRTHDYTDFGHLNYKGARKFTAGFNRLVQNLDKDKKQSQPVKPRII